MASKKPAKKVKSLPVKSVSAGHAKKVRGGLNPQPLPPRISSPKKINF